MIRCPRTEFSTVEKLSSPLKQSRWAWALRSVLDLVDLLPGHPELRPVIAVEAGVVFQQRPVTGGADIADHLRHDPAAPLRLLPGGGLFQIFHLDGPPYFVLSRP